MKLVANAEAVVGSDDHKQVEAEAAIARSHLLKMIMLCH